jgi:hypothetical protein
MASGYNGVKAKANRQAEVHPLLAEVLRVDRKMNAGAAEAAL